jgi:hypothetical protein
MIFIFLPAQKKFKEPLPEPLVSKEIDFLRNLLIAFGKMYIHFESPLFFCLQN